MYLDFPGEGEIEGGRRWERHGLREEREASAGQPTARRMSVESYAGTLLPDVAYAPSGAADVSRELESELTKHSGVVGVKGPTG